MASKTRRSKISALPRAKHKTQLKNKMSEWETGPLAEALKEKPEVRNEFRSDSGFKVKRLYTSLDFSDQDYLEKLGFPGQYPFTRGIEPSGYRTMSEWPLNFYSGYGSAEDTNWLYRNLIAAGAGDIWIAMDLPTQIGLDSDDPLAEGEVGKVGVALDTLKDLETVYDGIPMEKVEKGTVANSIGPWFLAMYIALLEKRGLDPKKGYLWLQNDPFKEYLGRGTYIFSPEVALDLSADAVAYSIKHTPEVDPQYACSSTYKIGCNAPQEIGFGIAHLMAYIEATQKKGVALEQLVPRLSVHSGTFEDFFEEIAKFRAMRRLWAKIAGERFKTNDPRVLGLRLTTYTNILRLTARQPLNNIVRTTAHVLISLFGGVEHILTPAYDEALALPTLESTRLASLIKNILHCEFFVDNTVDPLGGSYFLESLTDELEEKGREWFDKIEAMGGPIATIKSGFYQHEMADGIFRSQKAVESGERVLIGVNKFNIDEKIPPKLFRSNPDAERRQIERLEQVRRDRNNTLVKRCLDEVREVAEKKAKGKEMNIVPPMLDAVRAYASIGEIYGVLREVFGEYKPWTTIF
jgi:methylmalonyl-CoA mutase N-terminal domain/subunit